MIISKCPLRVSLVGGSTDLQSFIDTYDMGSVISFPCSLYTYITLNKRFDGMYRINYTHTETAKWPTQIQNDIAREVIKYFNLPPVTIAFNCDIPATGSGLATSSSYTIALVEAVNLFLKLNLSQFEVCELALKIERKFNKLTGYQDPYGCGLGGLKRLIFKSGISKVDVSYYNIPANILNGTSMYLVPTTIERSSQSILSTIDTGRSKLLLNTVDELEKSLDNKNDFYRILNSSWELKKSTSLEIMNNELDKIESDLKSKYDIDGLKLCGAGGGGFFLVLYDGVIPDCYKITIDNKGVQSWKI